MLYVLQVRDGLGPQIRTNVMMSLASGCQPEHLYGFISKIRSAVVFTCDPKETAYRFACEQGFKSCHHFVDGRPLSINGEGLCATHGFRVCCIVREMDADIFLAGISCKPYSLARTGRFSEDGGATSHDDAFMLIIYIRLVKRHQPKKSVLENVYGFLLAY